MISVIITSYKEPNSIGRAIQSFAVQLGKKDEIIVIAPDKETLDAARKYTKIYSQVRIVKDAGRGKPAAMNLAVKKAKGDILIWTDGDVYVSEKAVSELMSKMVDKNVGAVSGRPVVINPNKEMYHYWGYILYNIAHERRLKAISQGKRIFCSGYLFAIRKKLFPKLDEELLSEDGYISHQVYTQKHKVDYASKALVYVKYPNSFKDWIKQKRRSVGGYSQMRKMGINIRSFGQEAGGVFQTFKYIHNPIEAYWMFRLYLARVYMWGKIYYDVNLKAKKREELWKPIESTK